MNDKGIYTDFKDQMTYGEYLNLDKVLSSQTRLSGHHDEMLFIIIHQVSELWMKLILHEVGSAIDSIKQDELPEAFKMLARVSEFKRKLSKRGMYYQR